MNKYKSIFSPDKDIRADQFIIEILCKNRATSMKMVLPLGFTKLPEWATYFSSQLKKCREYIELYNEKVIIEVITKKKIHSLFPVWVKNEIEKEYKKTLATTETLSNIEPPQRILKSTGKESKDLNLEQFDDQK